MNTNRQVFAPTVLLPLYKTFCDEGYTHLLLESDAPRGTQHRMDCNGGLSVSISTHPDCALQELGDEGGFCISAALGLREQGNPVPYF